MIRLPRKHIADSVAERIIAAERRINADTVQGQGMRLEQALMQPAGDVAAVEGIEDMITARALDL
jgi:hypothetical protein